MARHRRGRILAGVTDSLARGQLAASEAPVSRAAAVRRNVRASGYDDVCKLAPRLQAALGEKLLEKSGPTKTVLRPRSAGMS